MRVNQCCQPFTFRNAVTKFTEHSGLFHFVFLFSLSGDFIKNIWKNHRESIGQMQVNLFFLAGAEVIAKILWSFVKWVAIKCRGIGSELA